MLFSGLKNDKKRILIVEDDPAQRALICHVLENEGYQMFEEGDGLAGVESATKKLPDLIIMDVMLPKLSGFDATRAIRSGEKTRKIPILMCTAKDRIADVEMGIMVGATDYISKPLDIVRLRIKVKRLLEPPAPPAQ